MTTAPEVGKAAEFAPLDILTTDEVAAYIRTPTATLRWWRHQGIGPHAFKLGGRKVMYRKSDVLDWLERQYAGGDAA